MTGDELFWLERSPSVIERAVHVNKLPFGPLVLVPSGLLSNAMVLARLEMETTRGV